MSPEDAEAELSGLYALVPFAFATVDHRLRILRSSSAFAALIGMGEDEILGRPIHTYFQAVSEVRPILRRVVETATPVFDQGARLAFRGAEVTCSFDALPLGSGNVRPTTVLIRIRRHDQGQQQPGNIAEQNESRALLASILATTSDALVVIDSQGRISYFSTAAERQFGYRQDEIIGRDVSVLLPDAQRSPQRGHSVGRLAGWARRNMNARQVTNGRRKDGATFPLELTLGEFRLNGRRHFTGFTRDLTETSRREQQLQDLQADLLHLSRLGELGEMATAIAHELRQPIAAATHYLNATRRLLARGLPSGEVRLGLEGAADQVTRAAKILDSIQSFARKSETQRSPCDLGEIIGEARDIAFLGRRHSSITLQSDIAPGLPPVNVDRIQIVQVLVNLMRNAIEAMQDSESKILTVSASPDADGFVIVSVADTGVGLAPEVAATLFQPFVTTKWTGMGVGLSISRTIIEDGHGGRIWVEARGSGGTVFHMALPAHQGTSRSMGKPDTNQPP